MQAAPLERQSSGATPLGELLVARSSLTRGALSEALLQQSADGRKLGELLTHLGILTERELAEALAEQLGFGLADLRSEVPDPAVVPLLSESVARGLSAIAVSRLSDGTIRVVTSEPSVALGQELANTIGQPIDLAVSTRTEVQRALDTSYRALHDVDQHVVAFQRADAGRAKVATANVAASLTDDAPVVQVVSKILTQALRDRASDVHIEPQDAQLRIRFRIDGALHDVLSLPAEMAPALVSRIKIMAGMNIVERRRPQDGQLAMEVDGRQVDVRVATVGTHWGEKTVMRILDKSKPLFKLGELGMPKDTHETLSKLIRAPFGMVICAGPTGSGKTTTLYAALSELNETHRNIMTIEDPVEYVFPSINQIQTNEQAGLTFATGLKSILRQDPDVILVGESRDVDTARIAVQSALTGHFVLSSLHATDAVAALHRFLDMGIESFLIASSVLAVVGQRLVRRTCTYCKAKVTPSPEDLAFYAEAGGRPKRAWYAGEGCNLCAGTGYSERIGVYELLRITPEIKRLVVGWATQEELKRMAVSQGMRTLQDEALHLVENDVTTIHEIVRSIYAL
ncbi:MAG: type pilus assembly protein PilB [Frankiaceae bacterium]|jgi:type IV pilus assembly protein PilB|nr:type pilus assembly protein PilB [Frankiaceae bacterium]MDX6226321.1 type pilus assembly protein PilB [Frankiales bacterium]MDX6275639.1 type pilus assembly protein PilB [Frankiales bacterium]